MELRCEKKLLILISNSHYLFSALNTIRPPDLSQQAGVPQQVLTHYTNDQNIGSARPVEVIVGVDLNTGTKSSKPEYPPPVQQPIVHRGSSFDHKIKPGPTIRPSASPVRYAVSKIFHYFVYQLRYLM